MTVPVRIVPMRWWHIDAILPLEDDLFGAERWSAAMFWNELANGHHYVVALEAADPEPTADPAPATDGNVEPARATDAIVEPARVVGYAGLALQPPAEAWVQNIAVRRDRQRGGVGRALLAELLRAAETAGARTVLLEVAVDNAPAQKLYAAYGFEPIGIRRGYYQPSNTDALVMERHG